MVVALENCPLALRGDLTKWLLEISPGVYVGQISARVRDNLWKRVCDECRNGRAIMAHSARNEQHLEFKVHNTPWEPIDFDGLKLMLRPSPSRVRTLGRKRVGYSSASKRSSVKRGVVHKTSDCLSSYVVIDLETTGIDIQNDRIVEICALKIDDGTESGCLCGLVRADSLPENVAKLTGITAGELRAGRELRELIEKLLDFIEDSTLIMHNSSFDMGFLDKALESFDMDELENECIDTLAIARKKLPNASSYRLGDLCELLGIEHGRLHRAQSDCNATNDLFRALMRL